MSNPDAAFFRNKAAWLFIGLCGAGIAGCATSLTGQNKETDRWKSGWVQKIVQGKDLKDIRERECVVVLPAEEIQRSVIAVVHYSKGRGYQNQWDGPLLT